MAGQRVPPAAGVVAEGTFEGLLAGVQFDVAQEVSLLGEGGSALVAVEGPFSCESGAAGETPPHEKHFLGLQRSGSRFDSPGDPEAFRGSAALSASEEESPGLNTERRALDVTSGLGSDGPAAGAWMVTRKDQLGTLPWAFPHWHLLATTTKVSSWDPTPISRGFCAHQPMRTCHPASEICIPPAQPAPAPAAAPASGLPLTGVAALVHHQHVGADAHHPADVTFQLAVGQPDAPGGVWLLARPVAVAQGLRERVLHDHAVLLLEHPVVL